MTWRRFMPASALVLAIRLGGAGGGFLIQLILARLLAPEALGTFFSATSLAAVLALLAAWGYPNLAPRFISRYRERNYPWLVSGFLRHAARDTAITSLFAGLAVIAIACFWPDATADNRIAFMMAGLAVPMLALLTLNAATAGAVRAFALSYVPESLARPLLFLGALGLLIVLKEPLTVEFALAVFFGVTAVIALGQFLILRQILDLGPGRRPPRLARVWRAEALPLVIVALFTALFADLDILMVTPFLHGADVAAFGIALKLALLVGFGVQVAHMIAAPDLADAHARRALDAAGTALRRATIFPVLLTGAATLACLAGGQYALALFHPDFVSAKWALTILVFCQFLRALAGPSVQLLTIIGAQRLNALLCCVALAMLAAGNTLLTPAYGVTGAAIAVALSWSVWLVLTGIMLHHRARLRSDLAFVGFRSRPAALAPAE
ncbi:MAG: polysaccharide biosynthesis C-terminal domain-containing protein [Rhizobiales bacterium]|nr:polysaccharide biosynthesis C-terminal domain-containing protein [Hyphomicrobiales bacterium]